MMRIYHADLPGGAAVRKGTWKKFPRDAWMKVQLCRRFGEWIALEVAKERTGRPGVLERDDDVALIRWVKCRRI